MVETICFLYGYVPWHLQFMLPFILPFVTVPLNIITKKEHMHNVKQGLLKMSI
jgi:hypothetical protein